MNAICNVKILSKPTEIANITFTNIDNYILTKCVGGTSFTNEGNARNEHF